MKLALERLVCTSRRFLLFNILQCHLSYRDTDGCLVRRAMAGLSEYEQQQQEQALDQPAKPGLGVWTLKQTARVLGAGKQHSVLSKLNKSIVR